MNRITDISYRVGTIPLATTFKTALRAVDSMENVVVAIYGENGLTGYGSAAPTAAITGETIGSISAGIEHLREQLPGYDIGAYEQLFQKLNGCIVGSNAAKAAVDIALHDLLGKMYKIPLYRLLGGPARDLTTDITISLDTPENMAARAREKVAEGFTLLKLKVGDDLETDLQRILRVCREVGDRADVCVDANQGWTPKEAIGIGHELDHFGVRIEFMEQPVTAEDYEGLRFVRERVSCPVIADESCFSPGDALRLVSMGAVDAINIKLMKCGGIYNALKIAAIAEAANIPCLVGSMMEGDISVTAAAHLATSRRIIRWCDLDAPLFCRVKQAQGGMSYEGAGIVLPDNHGLGIKTPEIYR